ncbi:MAG: hypothetical protein IH597_05380 [Bacteroidales bacterium]|nr:hypothetical protein [Bacteroidales bacterium]
MLKINNLLLVGGNSRHIGKTTLLCEIISAAASVEPVISLKVTSIYQNNEGYHGEHELLSAGYFTIDEEMGSGRPKDTLKMLEAGATRSFYIQVRDHAVEAAWNAFLKMVPADHLIVCESRSLRRFIEPGLFIYLKSSRGQKEKPYSLWLEKLADKVLYDPQPQDISSLVSEISLAQKQWIIS